MYIICTRCNHSNSIVDRISLLASAVTSSLLIHFLPLCSPNQSRQRAHASTFHTLIHSSKRLRYRFHLKHKNKLIAYHASGTSFQIVSAAHTQVHLTIPSNFFQNAPSRFACYFHCIVSSQRVAHFLKPRNFIFLRSDHHHRIACQTFRTRDQLFSSQSRCLLLIVSLVYSLHRRKVLSLHTRATTRGRGAPAKRRRRSGLSPTASQIPPRRRSWGRMGRRPRPRTKIRLGFLRAF